MSQSRAEILRRFSAKYDVIGRAAAFGRQYYCMPPDRQERAAHALSMIDLSRHPYKEHEDEAALRFALTDAFKLPSYPLEGVARQTPPYDVHRAEAGGMVVCSRIVSLVSSPAATTGQTIQTPQLIKIAPRTLRQDAAPVIEGTMAGTYVAKFEASKWLARRIMCFAIDEAGGGRLVEDEDLATAVREVSSAATTFKGYGETGGADYPQHYLGIPDEAVAGQVEAMWQKPIQAVVLPPVAE